MARLQQIPKWISSCDPPDDFGPDEAVDYDRAGGVGVYAGFRRIRSPSEAYRRFDALPAGRSHSRVEERLRILPTCTGDLLMKTVTPQMLERALVDALEQQGAHIENHAGMLSAWMLSEIPIVDGGFGKAKLCIDQLVRDLERALA